MQKEVIQHLHASFEDVAHEQDGVEFWLARDLQALLGYDEWRNFLKVIDKAKEACKNAGLEVEDQFVDVNKLITHGKGGQRSIADIMLTRYACYLIAQNGDPSKEPVVFANARTLCVSCRAFRRGIRGRSPRTVFPASAFGLRCHA